MDCSFVINSSSFSAQRVECFQLFKDTINGMQHSVEDTDRCFIYSDANSINQLKIAENYLFQDFIADLIQSKDNDLAEFLLASQDKSPMIDSIDESIFAYLSDFSFYFSHRPYQTSIDAIGLALNLEAILLSLNTEDYWNHDELTVCVAGEGENREILLKNISTKAHGKSIKLKLSDLNVDVFVTKFTNCVFSTELRSWINALDVHLRRKVMSKIELAHLNDFKARKEFIKRLNDCDMVLWELRFLAIHGGAVRIIFHFETSSERFLLCYGWVKNEDDEGYDQAITASEEFIKSLH